jgi:hypothetical protein
MRLPRAVRTRLGRWLPPAAELASLSRKLDDLKVLSAQSLAREVRSGGVYEDIHRAEFRVFSQFGDDGIIQYLAGRVQPQPDAFVELGVEDYTESNTRFLLVKDNWRGLVVDGDAAQVERIRRDALYWRHDLTAVEAFLTRENVNEVIASAGFGGPLGLLSLDVDGNDYWLWQALHEVEPEIVVVEYNSLFGPERPLVVPYRPDFDRTRAHYSGLYWGCSLRALYELARMKGYVFAGCNSSGNNAYFVTAARAGAIRTHTVESGFVQARFRQARDQRGALSYLSGGAQQRLIEDLPLQDLESGRVVSLREMREASAARGTRR